MPYIESAGAEVVRGRWPPWLGSRLDEWRASIGERATLERLARTVGETELAGSFPTSRVGEWLEGHRVPSPRTVFAVGEALRDLPVGFGSASQGWVSGPIALWAAGYFADCIGFLAQLTRREHVVTLVTRYDPDPRLEQGKAVVQSAALRVVQFLPPLAVLEYVPTLDEGAIQRAQTLGFGEGQLQAMVVVAREECAQAASGMEATFADTWNDWARKRSLYGVPEDYKAAYRVASDKNIRPGLRAYVALRQLLGWQEEWILQHPLARFDGVEGEDDRSRFLWQNRNAWELLRGLKISGDLSKEEEDEAN